ncbi:uncharacterized protein BJX67DRAFT_309734 [Aspergillus lucknowensis]|uniref:Uncharacterized protein n=1 Tax=Aspergillus lucknowensis TaxID=176173 RepID=A0ABR4LCI9_9EURO
MWIFAAVFPFMSWTEAQLLLFLFLQIAITLPKLPGPPSPANFKTCRKAFAESPWRSWMHTLQSHFSIWKQVGNAISNRIDCRRVDRLFPDRNLGHPSPVPPQPVLLGVNRKANKDWKHLRETVINVLDEHCLGNVAVAVRKDNKIESIGSGERDALEP